MLRTARTRTRSSGPFGTSHTHPIMHRETRLYAINCRNPCADVAAFSIICLLCAVLIGCSDRDRPVPDPNAKQGVADSVCVHSEDVDMLEHVDVLPCLDAPLPQGKNALWCMTFGHAWRQLRKQNGAPVVLSPDMPGYVDALNASDSFEGRIGLDADDIPTIVGMIDDGVAGMVEAEVRERQAKGHGSPLANSLPSELESAPPESVVIYATLAVSLKFEYVFDRFRDKLVFDGQPVLSFGLDTTGHKAYRQVECFLSQDRSSDLLVVIPSHDGMDELMLAQISPASTMKHTVRNAIGLTHRGTQYDFPPYGKLQIPIISLDLTKRYAQLEGNVVTAGKFKSYVMTFARQRIAFNLDEGGARLDSEAALMIESKVPEALRNLRFDAPFLVMIRRKGAEMPYFAMWVATPDILCSSGE